MFFYTLYKSILFLINTLWLISNFIMAHILKNKNLEIHIDLPGENYNHSRFDWTRKIVKVKFQNIYLSGVERIDCVEEQYCGKGFYNEFSKETYT